MKGPLCNHHRLRKDCSYDTDSQAAGPYPASEEFAMTAIRIGIVTISDRASRGEYEDRGGPAIRSSLEEILSCTWEAVPRVVPDERPIIESTLVELCDREGCCLVVTTGGTGPAPRDVTPEATAAVCDR